MTKKKKERQRYDRTIIFYWLGFVVMVVGICGLLVLYAVITVLLFNPSVLTYNIRLMIMAVLSMIALCLWFSVPMFCDELKQRRKLTKYKSRLGMVIQ